MKRITCITCGGVFDRSGHGAIRCLPCSNLRRPRLASPGRKRHGWAQPHIVGGVAHCLDCMTPMQKAAKGPPRARCEPCAHKRYQAMYRLRMGAAAIVAQAIKTGALKPAREFACTDCGRPAAQYDHRDYTKPLQVDPVCRSCNVMRGPADVWPDGFDPRPRMLIGADGAPPVPEAQAAER